MAAYSSPSVSAGNATDRLHAAFSKPLYQRCSDVNNIITESNVKELQHLFPVMVKSIFGCDNQPDWGIRNITVKHSQEFNVLNTFLSPDGIFFTLIWKLHSDPYLRYDFPITTLPEATRSMLDEGVLPQFYANKIQMLQGQIGLHSMISLNPFEYYMFHFAYVLVNSSSREQFTPWVIPSDALYPTLVEKYLNYFLPISGKSAPSLPNYTPVRSPVAHYSPVYSCQSQSSPPRRTPPYKGHHHRSLLKSSVLLSRSPAQQAASVATTTMFDQTENETWISEVVLQIFTEFWMNQTSYEMDKIIKPQRKNQHLWHNASFSDKSGGIVDYLYNCFVPSGIHVRLVRMMVKHLHYFVNSVSCTSSSPSSSAMPQYHPSVSAMDDFKRMVWPQTVQKFYSFLKNCFNKCPLDASFRLVLETWLSFIQPWRYQDPSDELKDPENSRNKRLDPKWKSFIMENLLFYSKLFEDILPRLCRMELSISNNAYMLFRVCKVYSKAGLKELIYEAESMLTEPMHQFSPRRQAATSQDIGASYLQPSQDHSMNASLVAPMFMQLSELEGAGFQYLPLFSDQVKQMVVHLLSQVQQAKLLAEDKKQQTKDSSSSSTLMHVLGFGALLDYNAPMAMSPDFQDDFNEVDSRKLGLHLDLSVNFLCDLFEVKQPQDLEKSVTWGGTSANRHYQPSTLLPDHYQTEDGLQITPLGRYQIINGLRKFDISYQGDPDLQPIRSFENGVLVRLLYQVSLYLNHRFADQITQYYNEEGFLGNFAYEFLHPPDPNPDSRCKSPLTKRQMEWATKPRISLRIFGNYMILGFMLLFYMILWLFFGFGIVASVFFFLLGILFHKLFKSIRSSRTKLKHT